MSTSAEDHWTSSHVIDAALARVLIDRCCPELCGTPKEFLGSGWDFEVWRCGNLTFRFPRRPVAVNIACKEILVLPGLVSLLTIKIPNPTVFGQPSSIFSAPYWGHEYIPGTTAHVLRLNPAQRGELAGQLGVFLRELHTIKLAQAKSIGLEEDLGRGSICHNQRRAKQSLPSINLLLGVDWSERLHAFIDAPPEQDAPVLCPVHGDLHVNNLIMSDNLHLAAIIDWGGMCVGDPALDLSIAYTFLPKEYRCTFWDAYGDVDASTKLRSRYLGVCRYGARALAYAIARMMGVFYAMQCWFLRTISAYQVGRRSEGMTLESPADRPAECPRTLGFRSSSGLVLFVLLVVLGIVITINGWIVFSPLDRHSMSLFGEYLAGVRFACTH